MWWLAQNWAQPAAFYVSFPRGLATTKMYEITIQWFKVGVALVSCENLEENRRRQQLICSRVRWNSHDPRNLAWPARGPRTYTRVQFVPTSNRKNVHWQNARVYYVKYIKWICKNNTINHYNSILNNKRKCIHCAVVFLRSYAYPIN